MKEGTATGRSMGGEDLPLLTEATTRESSCATKYVGEAITTGPMERLMTGHGYRTKCMDLVYCSGEMAKDMKVSSSTIKEKEKVLSPGQTEECISGSGRMESSTERAFISAKLERRSRGSGSMEGN